MRSETSIKPNLRVTFEMTPFEANTIKNALKLALNLVVGKGEPTFDEKEVIKRAIAAIPSKGVLEYAEVSYSIEPADHSPSFNIGGSATNDASDLNGHRG